MTETAGRSLDARIARGILKVKRFYGYGGDPWDGESDFPQFIPSGKPWRTHSIDARTLPRFSTDHGEVWRLAQGFLDSGWGIVTVSCPNHEETEPDKRHLCSLVAEGYEIKVHAETLPLAMCLAFLKATAAFKVRRSPSPAPGAQED